MNYEGFRNVVLRKLKEDGEWEVETDWGEPETGGSISSGEEAIEDFIELEQEKGAFYTFLSVSVSRLFLIYREEGWEAVEGELDKYVQTQKSSANRRRAANYTAGLSDTGKALFEELRRLRADIAVKKQLPAYLVFTNRTLFEMVCMQPGNMEELRAVYGVGEKKSREYGALFLKAISAFTKGEKLPVKKEEKA